MRPLFADGIDLPIVLIAGIVVLVPLMAFEVFVEAFVLKRMWRVPFQELCGLTFRANCWSLLAGIPTKILNAFFYSIFLPQDIPGFFARYPLAIAIGSFIYFLVTVLVESATAFRWLRRNQLTLSRQQIWRGMLLANIATYVVLSPLYYFATRPHNEIRQFTKDTRWASHATTTVLFVSEPDSYLKSIQADGSRLRTVVPFPMADYLVSSNLGICLFRGTNGNLYFYRHNLGEPKLIWQTTERYFMNQVAFSPSGDRVAFASNREKDIQLVDIRSSERKSFPLSSSSGYMEPVVAWSPDEEKFFAYNGQNGLWTITINAKGDAAIATLEGTNSPSVLTCYGRVGDGNHWGGGSDWGVNYSSDSCGDLKAWAEYGLARGLRIYHSGEKSYGQGLDLSVNPGILHFGRFGFGDVQFMDGCDECLFDANGYVYVLDINGKRLGTLAKGERFIQVTPRFEKRL